MNKFATAVLIATTASAMQVFNPTSFTYNQIETQPQVTNMPFIVNNAMPANSDPTCWKLAYGRGVGKPIHTCKPDEE